MKKFYLIPTVCVLLMAFVGNSQNYYITTKKDSVPCKEITDFSTNAQGKMVELLYTDKDGKAFKLKKNEMPDIKTLCMGGQIFDRMPLDTDRPDSYYRYRWA